MIHRPYRSRSQPVQGIHLSPHPTFALVPKVTQDTSSFVGSKAWETVPQGNGAYRRPESFEKLQDLVMYIVVGFGLWSAALIGGKFPSPTFTTPVFEALATYREISRGIISAGKGSSVCIAHIHEAGKSNCPALDSVFGLTAFRLRQM